MRRIVYFWRRNNWMLDPRSYMKRYRDMDIDRPVFLVGNQGDGLTLLSRMIRRNPDVISVTGNSSYWAGADEMQNVFEPILPAELSGIRLKAPKHSRYKPPRSWSYACDDLIGHYRNTAEDISEAHRCSLRHAIGLAISRYGKNIKRPRFIDKSQVFTVKISFIFALLEDCNPHFIHVTRNPYVSCYRAAAGQAGDMKRYAKFMDLDQRMEVCVQHWHNMAEAVEEDRTKVEHFHRVRFEDLLQSPHEELEKVCRFIDLEYSADMVPQVHHELPFGIKYLDRWYPLVTNINEKYLARIPTKYIEMVYNRCGSYAGLYGYQKPE